MDTKRVFWPVLAVVVALSLILSACAPAAAPTPEKVVVTSVVEKQVTVVVKATVVVKQTSAPVVVTATPAPTPSGPSCGTEPVKMNVYFETGFETITRLTEEFTKQYPNVTWDIKQDQFTNLINETPRLLSGDNPPDIIRLPTFVTFAKDGLLMNLDKYATAFGWNDWPVPLQFARLDANGIRGSGTLYAMGLNYQLTGVFYNKNAGGPDRHDRAAQDGRRVR